MFRPSFSLALSGFNPFFISFKKALSASAQLLKFLGIRPASCSSLNNLFGCVDSVDRLPITGPLDLW
jgi:hypothetical protein